MRLEVCSKSTKTRTISRMTRHNTMKVCVKMKAHPSRFVYDLLIFTSYYHPSRQQCNIAYSSIYVPIIVNSQATHGILIGSYNPPKGTLTWCVHRDIFWCDYYIINGRNMPLWVDIRVGFLQWKGRGSDNQSWSIRICWVCIVGLRTGDSHWLVHLSPICKFSID